MSAVEEIAFEGTPFPETFPITLFPRLRSLDVDEGCGAVNLHNLADRPIEVRVASRGNHVFSPIGMRIQALRPELP